MTRSRWLSVGQSVLHALILPIGTLLLAALPAPLLAAYEPVTDPGVEIAHPRPLFDRRTRTYWLDVSVTHQGGAALIGPLRLVVESANKTLINGHGETAGAEPYADLTTVPDALFAPGDSLGYRLGFRGGRGQLVATLRLERDVPETVNRPPVAEAGADQTLPIGSVVALDGSSSTDPDGDPLSFLWSFAARPPGSTASLDDPTAIGPRFTIDQPGTYELSLVVDDGTVASSPDSVFIDTRNSAPVADAGEAASVRVGDTAILDGGDSFDVDNDPIAFAWMIVSRPSESEATLLGANTRNPSIQIDRFGDYEIQLVVNDGEFDSDPDLVAISTANSAPVADAGPDLPADSSPVTPGSPITLDGSGSSDVDFDLLTYRWSLISIPTGSDAVIGDGNQAIANFTPDLIGTYIAQLIVNDGSSDSVADTVAVLVEAPSNQAPTADAGPDRTLSASPGAPTVRVVLDGTGSTDTDGVVTAYRWLGTPDPEDVADPFVYLAPGSHEFSLIVTDDLGAESTADTVIVSIDEAASPNAPVIQVEQEHQVQEGASLSFTVSAQDPDGDPVVLTAEPQIENASFSATPGTVATGQFDFTPDFDQQGGHHIVIAARDPFGYETRRTVRIDVDNLNRPPTLDVVEQAVVAEGETLALRIEVDDPDQDPVTVAAGGLPPNALFIESTRSLVFTPDFDQAGEYTLTFDATDGEQAAPTRTATLSVEDAGDSGAGPAGELVLNLDPVQSPTLARTQRLTGTVNAQGSPPPQPSSRTALITGMTPTNGGQGERLAITLTGESAGRFSTHFDDGLTEADFGAEVVVEAIQVQGPTEAIATVQIDPSATPGIRSVQLTTGDETAFSMLAFRVEAGAAEVVGRLLDPETGAPIADALVSIEGSNLSARSGADGSFRLAGVPDGAARLIVNSPNHELLRLDIDARAGAALDLGDIETPTTVFNPEAAPSVSVRSILGRGLGDSLGGGDIEDKRALVTDMMLLVGGSEAGVLDDFGNQLNPDVEGNGILSLGPVGVRLLAERMQRGGGTIGLGELLLAFSFGVEWTDGDPPTLAEWLDLLQERVDRAWIDPNNPDSFMALLMFNQGGPLTPEPPTLSPLTRLSPPQAFLFVASFLAVLPEPPQNDVAVPNGDSDALADRRGGFGLLRLAMRFLVADARADDLPAQDQRRFSGFWRGALGQRAEAMRLDLDSAFLGYWTAVAAAALPGWNMLAATQSVALASPLLGLATDRLRAAIGQQRIANIVPDPPLPGSITATVGRSEDGQPFVRVLSGLSPTQLRARSNEPFVYNLYRYRSATGPRERISGGLVRRADLTSNRLAFLDSAPLPEVVDDLGNRVGAQSATWFYTLTVTRFDTASRLLSERDLIETRPWWSLRTGDRVEGLSAFVYRTNQVQTSDYSVPVIARVDAGDTPTPRDIEVDPTSGDVFYGDPQSDPAKIVRIAGLGGFEERSLYALTGFKRLPSQPGHVGLAIDSQGTVYAENNASDASFGGRIFGFFQPDGAKQHVGSINYFSQLLFYANPVAAGPIAMGPGAIPENSPEDLYVLDELAAQVKRAPVQATYPALRRVAQPWADIPFNARAVDLEIAETGAGYLLVDRLSAPAMTVEVSLSETNLAIGDEFKVILRVGNPSAFTVEDVTPLPLTIEGEGEARLIALPDNSGLDLGPGETATFEFEYQAAVSGDMRFLPEVQGLDSSGSTVTGGEAPTEVTAKIVPDEPVSVSISLPEKVNPALKVDELVKVDVTIAAAASLPAPLREVRFEGLPLRIAPDDPEERLEIETGPAPAVQNGFELAPGAEVTFSYELRGLRRGLSELSALVTAVDPEDQVVSSARTLKVYVHQDALKVDVVATPDILALEKDEDDNPIPKTLEVAVTVTNITQEPLVNVTIPSRLSLSAVLDQLSVEQLNCPMQQTAPDSNAPDLILPTLGAGEENAFTRRYSFRVDDDGKCDVWTTVTAGTDGDPYLPPVFETGADRVRVTKDVLGLDVEFERRLIYLRDGGVDFAGPNRKTKLGEPFQVFGWIRNLSQTQKVEITALSADIIPGSTTGKISKPTILHEEDGGQAEDPFPGCGIGPLVTLDPRESVLFSTTVTTLDEPAVRERGIARMDLRYQAFGESIDPDGTRAPVETEIVEKRMPIDFDPGFANSAQGWYRFSDKALESFAQTLSFPAVLVEQLWKDETREQLLAHAWENILFVEDFWLRMPEDEREALINKYLTADEIGTAAYDATKGRVDDWVDRLGQAVGSGDYETVGDMTGPLAGELLAAAPELILTCGAATAARKATKEVAEEVLEEGAEAFSQRTLRSLDNRPALPRDKELTLDDLQGRRPGDLGGLPIGATMSNEIGGRIFGLGEKAMAKFRFVAEAFDIKIVARYRHPRSVELINSRQAIPKPEQIKLKNVNDIDTKYLGYADDDLATVVFMDKYDLELPGYSQGALKDVLDSPGPYSQIERLRNPGGFSDEEWRIIRGRYLKRVEEFDEFGAEIRGWAEAGETEFLFRYRENALDVDDEVRRVAFRLESREFTKGKRLIVDEGNGDRRISGDVDLVDVRNADGTLITDPDKRYAIWKALNEGEDAAQHMASSTWINEQKRPKFLDTHKWDKPDPEPIVEFGPDGEARVVLVDDHMIVKLPDGSSEPGSRMLYRGGYVGDPVPEL